MGNKNSSERKEKKSKKKGKDGEGRPASRSLGGDEGPSLAAPAGRDRGATVDSAAKNAELEKKIQTITPNEAIGQMLKNVPLLSKLTDAERALLGGALQDRAYNDGDNIIKQGEIGLGFYIIAKGDVVVHRLNEQNERQELARLKEGDFFGETALLTNAKRAASVTAIGATQCLYLERALFMEIFGPHRLNVQFAKRKAVAAEKADTLNNQTYVSKIPSNAVKEKDAATTSLNLGAMKDNVLFMNLDNEHKQQVVAEMWRSEVKEGESVIKQGDLGDNLYIIDSGDFNVFVNGKRVAQRGKGTCFGELALMYNSPRAATVVAATDAVVWVVDRFTFRRVVTDLSEKKFSLYVTFLKKVELLAPLVEYERKKIAEALEEVSFPAGHTIFKQGDEGDALYLVYSGEVRITKREGNSDAKEVDRVNTGGYFGERALLTNEPRAGSAVAITAVQLLRLDRNAFALLLGPLEDIMKQKMETYNDGSAKEKSGGVVESKHPEKSTKDRIPYESLKAIGTLGKGSFGHVKLVQDVRSGKTYALKAVSKAQIVQTGQQGHVMSEKKVMQNMEHPFLIQLFNTYKDKDRLYFLLELCLGGELFTVLREKTLFDEDTARFYAASVILAFEYMHDMNIIYRDLKPENLLLDKDGFLKVTDFGFAKDISSGRTWTLCGTPDYLAPEIVAGKGHGKGVDWWTLGIFIYEMLASYPPFYDEDPMKTYAKIMAGNVTFPTFFSKEAVSLIKKLLQTKATKRLGCLKGGAKQIKKHAWFKNFDWDALVSKRVQPPIIPKIKGNLDLSNFDSYPEDDQIEPYIDDGSNWDSEF